MQKKIIQVSFCILLLCIRENDIIEVAVCHSSAILTVDFLGQLNHAHKSWPTLSVVRHLIYCCCFSYFSSEVHSSRPHWRKKCWHSIMGIAGLSTCHSFSALRWTPCNRFNSVGFESALCCYGLCSLFFNHACMCAFCGELKWCGVRSR